MKIPSYLKNHVTKYLPEDPQENTLTSCFLRDSQGGELFSVRYYGEIFETESYRLLTDTENGPLKIIAVSDETKEEILLFDGACHGYDNMFVDTFTQEQIENRPLIFWDAPPSQVKIVLGYNNDYDSEKDDYDFDEDGNCQLIDGRGIPWEQVITDGIDWFALYLIDDDGEKTEIANLELA